MMRRGIIHIKIRQNGANNSGNYNFSLNVSLLAGNIPTEDVRLYADNTTGECSLWVRITQNWGCYNISIIKKTVLAGKDVATMGELSAVYDDNQQNLPDSSLFFVAMGACDFLGNAATSSQLLTARKIWGRQFDGSADIGTSQASADMQYVGSIEATGSYVTTSATGNASVQINGASNSHNITQAVQLLLANVTSNNIKDINFGLKFLDKNSTSATMSNALWYENRVAKMDCTELRMESCGKITIGSGTIIFDANGFHFSHGIYSDGFMSALGLNSDGSHSGGVTEEAVRRIVTQMMEGTEDQFIINNGHLSLTTVNDGTLNLQANGTTQATFTANQSSNTTFNIATGSVNGTISVGGTNVNVRGLGSMAYVSANDYVTVNTEQDITAFKTFSYGKGVRLKDEGNNVFNGILSGGGHLYIGSNYASGYHHSGRTYISTGWDGSEGNDTIYLLKLASTNGNSNNSYSSYSVLHSGNYGSFISVLSNNIRPSSNDTYSLGTNTYRWSTIYAVQGNLSGAMTLGGTLDVAGMTSLDSTLDVTGATTLGSTLSVNGATTLAGSLYVSGVTTHASSVVLNNDVAIQAKNSSGDAKTILALNTHNTLHLGYYTRQAGYTTQIQGNNIQFLTGTTTAGTISCTMNTEGLKVDAGVIYIGGAKLWYDSKDNVLRLTNSTGGAVHFCSAGAVSALGVNANVSGIISQAMTINNTLTVNDTLTVTGRATLNDIYTTMNSMSFYLGSASTTPALNLAINNGECLAKIYGGNGYIQAKRYYLSSTVYLEYNSSGSQLQLHIGSSTYNLTKTSA